jgi:hypothetical protein
VQLDFSLTFWDDCGDTRRLIYRERMRRSRLTDDARRRAFDVREGAMLSFSRRIPQ